MAHIVLVTRDADVRTVLDIYLHSEDHFVLTALEAQQALAALQVSRYPAVVVVHASAASAESFVLLQRAADDASGNFARNRYIVLMPDPTTMPPLRRAHLARLKARVLALPVDLDEVGAAVEVASRELHGNDLPA
jgi:DNA-binding NtrC family response regulator